MAGDEIVADWLGDINSFYINSNTTVVRISATSLRYRTVQIYNLSSSRVIHLGWYNSNSTTFTNYSMKLGHESHIKFEFIDLYNLGCYSTGAASVRFLCLNEY